MIHLGDITLLNGAELEPVHCTCGGSPCQDLSCAGKRKGLQHSELGDEETTRSGLFMDQMRINKELRDANKESFSIGRWSVWENVPGAYSSNNGCDFSVVLTETIRVKYPDVPEVPMPKGGWPTAGLISCRDMSLAWRTHDGQFFGCPQRRRRICVVSDYEGNSAERVVFGKPMLRPYDWSKKSGRKPFIYYVLQENRFGELEWVETQMDISYLNIGEKPDPYQEEVKLWIPETGEYSYKSSILSNILEKRPALKYYLSPKACQGILTRAKNRGKQLPPELFEALTYQAEHGVEDLEADSDEDIP